MAFCYLFRMPGSWRYGAVEFVDDIYISQPDRRGSFPFWGQDGAIFLTVDGDHSGVAPILDHDRRKVETRPARSNGLPAYRYSVYWRMIRSYGDRRTQRLHEDQVVRAFQGFARRAKRKLESLHAASRLEDLTVPPSNRLEKLKGDLKGFYSIRINDQWRLVFRWHEGDAHDVRVIDYH